MVEVKILLLEGQGKRYWKGQVGIGMITEAGVEIGSKNEQMESGR